MRRLFTVFLVVLVGFMTNCGGNESETTISDDLQAKPSEIKAEKKTEQFKTVHIGDQVWMAKNLNVDHYRNGDPIPEVKDLVEWKRLTTGAWCYYDNDPANGEIYGKLYNWYTVNDPRGLAPEGWHVSTDEEWQTLVDYLGGEDVAGGKMKGKGIKHWESPNEGATNESGFTALPGGFRSDDGNFIYIGYFASFWSSTDCLGYVAWSRNLFSNYSGIARLDSNERNGFSVRCLRDK
jgi:uncharacterized protein (TIGR02145 family)